MNKKESSGTVLAFFAWLLLCVTVIMLPTRLSAAGMIQVPTGINHQAWDSLLQKYVDARGLVDYSSWHKSPADRTKLNDYLQQYAAKAEVPARGDERIAALINAYNAFTIDFILDNYPTESIRLLDDEFKGKRYRIDGTLYSAEDIELATLRPLIGWKMHSAVVCAARSCPPLLNRAYFTEDWEKKTEARYRVWLARPDLNSYDPDSGWGRRGKVEISKIFLWHSVDFNGAVSVSDVLEHYGPHRYFNFLKKAKYRIGYQDYHWGLNDQGNVGADYEHSIFNSIF